MNKQKKLESLQSATFQKNFNDVLGGGNSTPPPTPTGALILVTLNGVLKMIHRPEGPASVSAL